MSTKQWNIDNIDRVREYKRTWYYKNKDKQRIARNKRKLETRKWLIELKSSLKCISCGESSIECLDFHHRNPAEKDINIASVVVNGWSKQRIQKEMTKCDVLCANCHRKLHKAA